MPRVNNEPVDVDKTDPIELFKIHEDSSRNSVSGSFYPECLFSFIECWCKDSELCFVVDITLSIILIY